MRTRGLYLRILVFSAACWTCAAPGFAQEQGPPRQTPDVVRINTSLVQTDVMVFDKQGNFVDGLKRDQFTLKVDGKPREISFFEKIVAGSRNEEAQLAAARGGAPGNSGAIPLDRGRTVFFFIDDLHLSLGSLKQVRDMLRRFIDSQMGQNDEVAVTSGTGQIGFLQQLTDDKTVLHAALDRIQARTFATRDFQRPVITEYQAQLIEAGNEDLFTFFVDEAIRLAGGPQNLPRNVAAAEIQGRASQISQQASYITNATLNSLNSLVKHSAALPGRKIVFVVSDGFLLDSKNSDSADRLRQVTSAAAAAGVVIYSIDASGLTGGMPDASIERAFDPSGRLERAAAGEKTANQDGLNALAVDTGGRAFRNNNQLSPAVTTALKETSGYYLLAWRPDNDEQRNQRSHRVEVSVSGRPDLSVRFHRGFGDPASSDAETQKKKEGETTPKPTNELMRQAMTAAYPKSDLPVAISLNFLDLVQLGPTLTTSVKISTNSMVLEAQEGQQVAVLDVAGGVYDDQGKPVSSFNKHLTIRSKSGDAKTPPPDNIFYSHFTSIKPGLYQVRVAAVDSKQGRAGSAVRWIEIPDPSSKVLMLSSLVVGERKSESEAEPVVAESAELIKSPEPIRQVSLNIDHRFASSSHLRFVTFVYNASGSLAGAAPTLVPSGQGTSEPASSLPASANSAPANSPDLAVQVQLFRDNEPILTTPLHKISIDALSDVRRLPYAAEVDLGGLQPGRYLLLVTVIDRLAKVSASQRFVFRID